MRIVPVVGTRQKSWQVLNEHSGLVRYFDGTRKEAAAEAKRIGAELVLK